MFKELNKCCRCGRTPIMKKRPLMFWVQCSCGYSLRYFLDEGSATVAWNELNRVPEQKGGRE